MSRWSATRESYMLVQHRLDVTRTALSNLTLAPPLTLNCVPVASLGTSDGQ